MSSSSVITERHQPRNRSVVLTRCCSNTTFRWITKTPAAWSTSMHRLQSMPRRTRRLIVLGTFVAWPLLNIGYAAVVPRRDRAGRESSSGRRSRSCCCSASRSASSSSTPMTRNRAEPEADRTRRTPTGPRRPSASAELHASSSSSSSRSPERGPSTSTTVGPVTIGAEWLLTVAIVVGVYLPIAAIGRPRLDRAGRASRKTSPGRTGRPATSVERRVEPRKPEPRLYNRLAVLRAERGLSRQDLADAVDVNYQTIGYLERGEYNPSLDLAFKIAELFGRSDRSRLLAGTTAAHVARLYGRRRTPMREPA